MRLYFEVLKMIVKRFLLRQKTGIAVKDFAEKMGVVYVKLAQILAMQNYGEIFTEEDRERLAVICNDCNPLPFAEIEEILEQEYGENMGEKFLKIEETPVGSASVSQVHKAVLKTGEVVVLKIKRREITRTMEKDLRQIRRIVHRFGKLVKFRNFTGGDLALDLYLDWIRQEIDFQHECENIKTYQAFAENVNGRLKNTKKIRVPKLYEELCTENVIVMEFIETKTINTLGLNQQNKALVAEAMNDYLKLSFWALLNDQPIVFHGDPHGGNICVDENNIYFLDMGLLSALSEEDAQLCRKFFLAAYSKNYEKLFRLLAEYGDLEEEKREAFREDCRKYCEELARKDVTFYFVDMMNICLRYEFVPPKFLFPMAKSFLCLNGINQFSGNKCTARELLQPQVAEFLVRRSLKDCQEVLMGGVRIIPNFMEAILQDGLSANVLEVIMRTKLREDFGVMLENGMEAWRMMGVG